MNGAHPRRARLIGAVALAAALGAALGWGPLTRLRGVDRASASPPSPSIRTNTAPVERTTVASRQATIGTLGYAGSYTVASELANGVLTRVPPPGAIVTRGQPLYEVNGTPIPLLYGVRPGWRDFRIGMEDGPDVAELERNLVALGFDPQHDMTVDRSFTWVTAAVIERWQRSLGEVATGSLPLGQVAILPRPVRIAIEMATVGATLTPGTAVVTATSTTPVVQVALDVASEGLIHRGDRVLVTLPGGERTTPGTVNWVSPVAVEPPDDGSGQGPSGPMIPITVRLDRPGKAAGFDQAPVQVIITQQEHRGVLAVPITALLARPQGYAVAVVGQGARRLIPVTTGLFDDASGIVEVAGSGLAAGMRVEVAGG